MANSKLGNRGLGAVIARKFAAEGSNIAINYASSKETADKIASDLAAQYNVKTIVVQGVCVSIGCGELIQN